MFHVSGSKNKNKKNPSVFRRFLRGKNYSNIRSYSILNTENHDIHKWINHVHSVPNFHSYFCGCWGHCVLLVMEKQMIKVPVIIIYKNSQLTRVNFQPISLCNHPLLDCPSGTMMRCMYSTTHSLSLVIDLRQELTTVAIEIKRLALLLMFITSQYAF